MPDTAIVVGAGVVGLAIARALARSGRDVTVVEAEPTFGAHQSSRNSEVIHAGIYYPPGSVKAQTCIEGKDRLYAWCRKHSIAHRRLGKLIVAIDSEEVDTLARLEDNAVKCGLTDLELVDAPRCRALEPAVLATAGLFSKTTGIIDSHAFLASLLADAESAGARVAWRAPFEAASRRGDHFEVTAGGTAAACDILINAAGLGAQAVAKRVEGITDVPPRRLVKGSYFRLTGRAPCRHLVYPVPATASLGIHLTLDLEGAARFGPDQEWTDRIDYQVDPTAAARFYTAVRRYWPDLPDGALTPDYAGVRAKLQGPGEPMRDFMIEGPQSHGVAGLVNLFGIESPGLTAALALPDAVLRLL